MVNRQPSFHLNTPWRILITLSASCLVLPFFSPQGQLCLDGSWLQLPAADAQPPQAVYQRPHLVPFHLGWERPLSSVSSVTFL